MQAVVDAELSLGQQIFSSARLGDRRRSERLASIFDLMRRHPGGHQNRRGDKRPGWLVLWRGWTKLQSMLDGYAAATSSKRGKS